jgi:Suppressor of fused protein (SUFU)
MLVSAHIAEIRDLLFQQNGEPDDVWSFPALMFSSPPPLGHVDVAAWNQGSAESPWTMFVTIGMSEPPSHLGNIQRPTELMLHLPVLAEPTKTHPIALWMAGVANQPFATGRAYLPFDLIPITHGIPEIPLLNGFDALIFLDETVHEVGPWTVAGIEVSILHLAPIDKALADLRRSRGIDAFRAAFKAD